MTEDYRAYKECAQSSGFHARKHEAGFVPVTLRVQRLGNFNHGFNGQPAMWVFVPDHIVVAWRLTNEA